MRYEDAKGKVITLAPKEVKVYSVEITHDRDPIDVAPIVKYFRIPQGEVAPDVVCEIRQEGRVLKSRPVSNIAFGTTDTKKGELHIVLINNEEEPVDLKLRVTTGILHKEVEPIEVPTS